MLERTISDRQAKEHFAQLLQDVSRQSQTVVIEQAGQPMAVLIPVEQYRQLKRLKNLFSVIEHDLFQFFAFPRYLLM